MLNKAQRRIASLPHDVYKAYSANGDLLYVGISVNFFHRLREHRQYSAWIVVAERIDVRRVISRDAARAEEARCIREDKPAYNVTREQAFGCEISDSSLEEFTLRQCDEGWFIDE